MPAVRAAAGVLRPPRPGDLAAVGERRVFPGGEDFDETVRLLAKVRAKLA